MVTRIGCAYLFCNYGTTLIITGPLAFFLCTGDHTLWLVLKVHLITIPTDNSQWSVKGDRGGGGVFVA